MSNNQSLTNTTVGPTIVIRGRLKSDEDLVVKGRIDAEIVSSKALFIENSGVVKANVQVRSVRINGILVGNITASEKAEIASDGRVVGDICAPKLIIADGAAFRGHVDMPTFDDDSGPPAPGKRAHAVAVAKEPAAGPAEVTPASNPEESAGTPDQAAPAGADGGPNPE